jgi:hypothetical protein
VSFTSNHLITFIMKYPFLAHAASDGGVEEKKDEEAVVLSPSTLQPQSGQQRPSSFLPPHNEDVIEAPTEAAHTGFQDQIEKFAKSIFESCGTAVSFLLRGGEGGCQWPGGGDPHRVRRRSAAPANPPLSITEELRKLAEAEGRVFGGGMRRADIPRFLGEEAVYSFDDDNISAISQHTLEEMTKHGIKHPVRRKPSNESTLSASSLQPPHQLTEKRSDESGLSVGKNSRPVAGMDHRDKRTVANQYGIT